MPTRPTRLAIGVQLAAVAAAAVVAVATNGWAQWDLTLFVTLTVLSVISDLIAVQTRVHRILVSASLMAIVIGAVLLGPGPAAAIGLLTILSGWAVRRYRWTDLLINLVAYLWFPLAAGIAFHWIADAGAVAYGSTAFYLAIFAAFLVAIAANFLVVGSYSSYMEGSSFLSNVRGAVLPVLPSELTGAILGTAVSLAYVEAGTAALALIGVLILVFQYLVGALLQSQDRAEQLELRTRQLIGFQVTLLMTLLRTLDLRDRASARHSAAVARYSREIAAHAGLSAEEQEMAHAAGLLHDIGKFILPDEIIKARGRPLTEAESEVLKRHPHEGARIVSQVEGYQPIGAIILAHHERVDGQGYPRGLRGEEIPALARVVSVANRYDMMTGPAASREPVDWRDALTGLRQVAGTELDPEFVEVFANVLGNRESAYRRGEDVDFEVELALNERIRGHMQAAATEAEREPGSDGSGIRV